MATPTDLFELHIQVEGVVQGVGFRWFTCRRARALGLVGWVKNVGYHNVEITAQGRQSALEELYRDCRSGPSWASVSKVTDEWKKINSLSFSDFTIEYQY